MRSVVKAYSEVVKMTKIMVTCIGVLLAVHLTTLVTRLFKTIITFSHNMFCRCLLKDLYETEWALISYTANSILVHSFRLLKGC